MATTLFTAVRRFAGVAFTLSLVSLCLCIAAAGQSATSLVTSSVTSGLTPPATWDAIWQTAASPNGDFVAADFEGAATTQWQAGSITPIIVYAPGSSGPGGAWANNGLAIDPWNNLWLNNNWNGGIGWVPYNAATRTWNTAAAATCANNLSIGYYQTAGMAINSSGTLAFSTENGAPNVGIDSMTVTPTCAVSNFQAVVVKSTARARALAMDNAGNIYEFQDGGLPGVIRIPAGTVNLATDQNPNEPAKTVELNPALLDVEPMIPNPGGSGTIPLLTLNGNSTIDGMAVDGAGNVYIGSSQYGVFMVPNENGTPNPLDWVMVSPIPASAQISIDPTADTLYVPTSALWPAPATPYSAVNTGKAAIGVGEAGAVQVGKQAANPLTVQYSFTSALNPTYYLNLPQGANSISGNVTPARFVIQEGGVTAPDFQVSTGGTCAAGTTYPVLPTGSQTVPTTSCTLNVTFTPHHVGSVSAVLLMQTAQTTGGVTTYTTVATTRLHGTGLGALIQTTPAIESAIGSGLKTPSQITTDVLGNIYVADSGLNKVLMYAAGSSASVTIGSGFTQVTGVAVDGNGDVFIADGGAGSVDEVPYGATASGQITLLSGLGGNLTVAVDGLGHLFVADPSNGRVVELSNLGGAFGPNSQAELFLTTGFKTPSYVAVDPSNNLFVIDGANLFEVPAGATLPTAWLTNLSGATGVAVDPSGAVYVSSSGGTIRIPYVGGALDSAGQTSVATSVTSPAGVAVDNLGNVYLADGTALNVHLVATSGTLNFGNVALNTMPSLNVPVTNAGNSPLTVTGYTSANTGATSIYPPDYSGADGTCIANSPIAAGASCQVAVTLNPGPGEQGTLAGQIAITSNAANPAAVIDATGVSAALANSKSAGTVLSASQVVNTQITITVAASSGTNTPSGTVTVTYPTWTVETPNPCGSGNEPACVPTVTPTTATASGTLTNGKLTLTLAPVLAGSDTFNISYGGDRVFGRSTTSVTFAVAKSLALGYTLPPSPDPTDIYLPLTLEEDGSTPYDSSVGGVQYNFKVTVNTAAGIPTGTLTFNDNSTACPPGTSPSGTGATACQLTNYTGIACPQQAGAAVVQIQNSGALLTGAQASFATSCLPMPQNTTYTPFISTHFVTPVYSGDSNFLPPATAAAGTLFQVIRNPGIAFTNSAGAQITTAPSLTVSAGSTTSIALYLSSILGYGAAGRNQAENDYNFPVTLSCTSLPPHATCSFSYPNPDPLVPTALDITCPSGTNQNVVDSLAAGLSTCSLGMATLTINTDVTAGTSTTTTSQVARVSSIALAGIFGLGMIGLFFRRKAFERARMLLVVFLIGAGCALAVSITACSTTNLSPNAALATPSGTYTVQVTAQQVGNECITAPAAGGANCIIPGSGSATNNGLLIYGSSNQLNLPFYINVTVQ
jgi:sugar lactone lactonase YvrE